jgi:hypothetical protein
MVGGPLQLPAGVVQVHHPGQLVQRLPGCQHGGQQGAVQLVDPVVERREQLAPLGVTGTEGLHGQLDHPHCLLAHLLQMADPSPAPWRADDHLAELGDVGGHVTDAFQVLVDVEDGGEQAQIGSDRRVAAEQVDHLPLDVQVPAVDLVVTGDHRAAQGRVPGHQPARGPGQGGPDQHALRLDVGLQVGKGVMELVSR